MQLHVIARGKLGRSPEAELVERYARRIAWPLRLTELTDVMKDVDFKVFSAPANSPGGRVASLFSFVKAKATGETLDAENEEVQL